MSTNSDIYDVQAKRAFTYIKDWVSSDTQSVFWTTWLAPIFNKCGPSKAMFEFKITICRDGTSCIDLNFLDNITNKRITLGSVPSFEAHPGKTINDLFKQSRQFAQRNKIHILRQIDNLAKMRTYNQLSDLEAALFILPTKSLKLLGEALSKEIELDKHNAKYLGHFINSFTTHYLSNKDITSSVEALVKGLTYDIKGIYQINALSQYLRSEIKTSLKRSLFSNIIFFVINTLHNDKERGAQVFLEVQSKVYRLLLDAKLLPDDMTKSEIKEVIKFTGLPILELMHNVDSSHNKQLLLNDMASD